MHHRIRLPGRALSVLAAAGLVLGLAACGGGSGPSAESLLQQTFSGAHPVNSGNLSFALTIQPTGSSSLNGPLTLSFGGPFQSQGQGKLPKSNFAVTISAQGKSASLGILSTGSAGYVTLQGSSYQLPPATFRQLESSFAGLASSPGGGGRQGTLARLGIHPQQWLRNPKVVGSQSVGGTDTTHIHASIDVPALLGDLNTLLAKASSLGIKGAKQIPAGISAQKRQQLAAEVRNPTVDLWTGKDDKTLRKLAVNLTVPVSGRLQGLLGGLRAAQIGLTMQYSDLGQPQTIAAPTNVSPFSQFSARLRTVIGALGGGSASSATAPAPGSSTPSPAGASSGGTSSAGASSAGAPTARWSHCIMQAHNDVAKMQRCSVLLGAQ